MSLFYPDSISIERGVRELPLTRRILERCSGVPVQEVESAKEAVRNANASGLTAHEGKHRLLLCRNRGLFVEPCPGTKEHYRCCRYAILNTGTGCPLHCTYCVLQAYLNNPFITLYVNQQDMFDELVRHAGLCRGKILRIGTGEYMDSLALDHLTGFTATILPVMKRFNGAVLELKTKTACIDGLLELDHGGACIVSWSLNSDAIAVSEEGGAAMIDERIACAVTLAGCGYRVGFHFDPLIYHSGWEEGYRETIMKLAAVPPEAISWISIGSLRYMPNLKGVAQQNYPETAIYTGEFVPGLDGKMRYLQEIRIEMYEKVVGWLRESAPGVFLYFCMEHPAVWQRVMGYDPGSNMRLKDLLDACARCS